jgi:hypothetical protein
MGRGCEVVLDAYNTLCLIVMLSEELTAERIRDEMIESSFANLGWPLGYFILAT